ncbi:MAG: UDP-N-acetylglucosamine 2-epimerase (non-hydrolyzing), partial [Acidobacteria bacterium]
AFYLCTVHRAENTDQPERLAGILAGLARLDRPVVLPLHPRTAKRLKEFGLTPAATVRVIEPVGYFDMLQLERSAAAVLTDSGGVQKEAYYLDVPCVTLRNETEWVETVEVGWNILAGTDPDAIVAALDQHSRGHSSHPPLYGNGDAAAAIVGVFDASD